jgi:hypothetical protein
MTIKRYTATKDNVISTAFKENLNNRASTSNMGASDVLEIFSIFGQASSSSLERARILVEFPVSSISQDRDNEIIPASGNVDFVIRIGNAEHGQTTPSNFTLSAHPLVQPWDEGRGLDMESYLDSDASNWLSRSLGATWSNTGSSFIDTGLVTSSPIPKHYTQSFSKGTEDVELNITGLVEEWIKSYKSSTVQASGAISFDDSLQPENNSWVIIRGYGAQEKKFVFVHRHEATGSSTSNIIYVSTGSSGTSETLENLHTSILSNYAGVITASIDAYNLRLTQVTGGFAGNLALSQSNLQTYFTALSSSFAGGQGLQNYGVLLKLSGAYEDSSLEKSFYTKKLFSRSSEYFFKRPVIEARWDDSVKDDRSNIIRSSSLATSTENLNNIYLYNKRRTGYMNIPNTGSRLVVQFRPTNSTTPVTITHNSVNQIYVTASKTSTGIYKAIFAYSGSETTLRDIWQRDDYTATVSGSAASASISFASIPLDQETFFFTDTLNVTASFIVSGGVNTNDGTQVSGNYVVGRSALADTAAFVTRLHEVITAQTASAITSTASGSTLQLVQDNTGSGGNTSIDLSGFSGASLSEGSGFQGGVTFVPDSHTYTGLHTGSAFTVNNDKTYTAYDIPNYITNITNLKKRYSKTETATFRVYTRNKNWRPNVYTVATQTAPVDTIRDAYYKVRRVSDDLTVINFSTGSSPYYSALSYDASGSYFDLDMSILEPNYLYEISFLYKDGNNYIEQKERFKFRVDP